RTADPAPRDSASSPSAPLPANRSSTRAPGTAATSQLNSVSRTRSDVGRNPSISATGNLVPRQRPPMTRTCPGVARLAPPPGFRWVLFIGMDSRPVLACRVIVQHVPARHSMVSFFRRKKPETPSGSESARRYSAEELAAAFPTAPAGGAVPAPVARPAPPAGGPPPPAPAPAVVEAEPGAAPVPPGAHAAPSGPAALDAVAERGTESVTEPAAPVAVVAEPRPSKPT